MPSLFSYHDLNDQYVRSNRIPMSPRDTLPAKERMDLLRAGMYGFIERLMGVDGTISMDGLDWDEETGSWHYSYSDWRYVPRDRYIRGTTGVALSHVRTLKRIDDQQVRAGPTYDERVRQENRPIVPRDASRRQYEEMRTWNIENYHALYGGECFDDYEMSTQPQDFQERLILHQFELSEERRRSLNEYLSRRDEYQYMQMLTRGVRMEQPPRSPNPPLPRQIDQSLQVVQPPSDPLPLPHHQRRDQPQQPPPPPNQQDRQGASQRPPQGPYQGSDLTQGWQPLPPPLQQAMPERTSPRPPRRTHQGSASTQESQPPPVLRQPSTSQEADCWPPRGTYEWLALYTTSASRPARPARPSEDGVTIETAPDERLAIWNTSLLLWAAEYASKYYFTMLPPDLWPMIRIWKHKDWRLIRSYRHDRRRRWLVPDPEDEAQVVGHFSRSSEIPEGWPKHWREWAAAERLRRQATSEGRMYTKPLASLLPYVDKEKIGDQIVDVEYERNQLMFKHPDPTPERPHSVEAQESDRHPGDAPGPAAPPSHEPEHEAAARQLDNIVGRVAAEGANRADISLSIRPHDPSPLFRHYQSEDEESAGL